MNVETEAEEYRQKHVYPYMLCLNNITQHKSHQKYQMNGMLMRMDFYGFLSEAEKKIVTKLLEIFAVEMMACSQTFIQYIFKVYCTVHKNAYTHITYTYINAVKM